MPIHHYVTLECNFCGKLSGVIRRNNAEPPVRDFEIPGNWYYEQNIPSAIVGDSRTTAVLCPGCLEFVKGFLLTMPGQKDPR